MKQKEQKQLYGATQMRLEIKNRGQRDIILVLPHKERIRLKTTCFRGTQRFAGNFAFWRCTENILNDRRVLNYLVQDIREADRLGAIDNGLCIDLDEFVGWTSTDKITKYRQEDLVPFKINQRSSGLLVKRERRNILAPQTTEFTVVYKIKRQRHSILTFIYSIYPGEDIGELQGNVSEREKCVFFHWEHPGALS